MIRAIIVVLGLSGLLSIASPTQPVYAADKPDCDKSIIGIPPWYKGLTDDKCNIKKPDSGNKGVDRFILRIAANILNIMLVLVVYIATGFIIYGGYYYLISAGNASRIAKAKSLILNAVVGLIIAALAAAIVGFVAGQIVV
ncbi:hypothetical protein H6796_03230 [Candidatus Nomurabacteria bacterium]|nr:hypothetical protein [Candidatus Nomurabacteria bacterium]